MEFGDCIGRPKVSNESFDDETAVPPKDASSVVVDKDREDSEIFTEANFLMREKEQRRQKLTEPEYLHKSTQTKLEVMTESSDEFDDKDDFKQFSEAQFEEKKRQIQELLNELKLMASGTKAKMQAMKKQFDGNLAARDEQNEETRLQVTSLTHEKEELQRKLDEAERLRMGAQNELEFMMENKNKDDVGKSSGGSRGGTMLFQALDLFLGRAEARWAEKKYFPKLAPISLQDLDDRASHLPEGLDPPLKSVCEPERDTLDAKEKKPLPLPLPLPKEFDEKSDDVTNVLPKGASSIVVAKDTETWQVFTEVSFGGVTANLEPGKKYKSPEEMGLQESVKSFRKAP